MTHRLQISKQNKKSVVI